MTEKSFLEAAFGFEAFGGFVLVVVMVLACNGGRDVLRCSRSFVPHVPDAGKMQQ